MFLGGIDRDQRYEMWLTANSFLSMESRECVLTKYGKVHVRKRSV